MKATRDWFGEVLAEVGEQHEEVVVVNCDLGSATKTLAFAERFPERFFECGIAEANAIGIAAGLAQEGFRPFVASFGHFLTGKYLEVFQSVGLNGAGVVLVGTHAGLAIGKDGPTQMGLRDLGVMRTLPNVEVLHPVDGEETRQVLDYLVGGDHPSYLRLCRQPQREIHDRGYRFRFGQPDVLRRGTDVAVFSMGGMLEVLMGAADELAEQGIDPTVVNISSLPVDPGGVREIAGTHPAVYVVEDHHSVGGVADEIGRILLSMSEPPPVRFWGVPDYGQAAAPADLYARYRLDQSGVVEQLKSFVPTALTGER